MTRVSILLTSLLMTLLLRHCDAEFTLTLIHTNDIHAHYEQFNKYGGSCSAEDASANKCFGGYARLKTAVDKYRAENPNSLVLDGGDQYQGTLWFYKYGGNVTKEFVNWIRYDAMTIGNHEFDKGVPGLVPYLQGLISPVVSCNLDASHEPSMQGLYNKSTVLWVGSHRVGIVGYTTAETPHISDSGNMIFKDVIESITEEVQKLRAEGVKVIIALGHAGYNKDQQIARIPGVDVVVGGHSHSFLYTGTPPSNDVPVGDYPTVVTRGDRDLGLVVQCFTMAKYLCVLNVTFDDQGGITSYEGKPHLQDASVAQDNATMTKLDPWRQGIEGMRSEKVGQSMVRLDGDRTVCRRRECNMGNVLTDGMLYYNLRRGNRPGWSEVSIAIINAGGVRESIQIGNITYGDVISVQPFGNKIDAIRIEGRYLKEAFEYCASNVKVHPAEDPFGGFLQVSGLRVQYNLAKPDGQRVVSLKALCTECQVPEFKPVQDDTVYKVILPNFVYKGGDGYTVFKEKSTEYINLGDLDSDVFIQYIKDYSPLYTAVEERIQFVQDDECGQTSPASFPCSLRPLLLVVFVFVGRLFV